MSKNFELLHNISNEKELFQTLDGWEGVDEASISTKQEARFDEGISARIQQQSPLPDVFQAVDDTLGSIDLETPDLSHDLGQVRKPIQAQLESLEKIASQDARPETRFPISRNPTTRFGSDLDIPQAWVKPDIETNPRGEVELELEPQALPSGFVPDSQRAAAKTAGPGETKEVEKKRYEPLRPGSLPDFGAEERKSIGGSRARRGRTRHAYKDPKREAIVREEELKLVQRIFLAEENSQRMVLFSGFERDTSCASICIRSAEILAAQTDGSVCLMDMGFQVPSLHEYCGVQNDRGLAEAIAESAPIQEFARQLSPANLWVITAGHGAPELSFAKAADRLRVRMEELRKAFRFVVVHSGSLWLNADAMLLSKWTDGVVLILEAHSTRRDTARRIKESLAAANARVLGVVLNNRTYPIPETLYSRL